ncbi:MAG: hypothetical protein CL484_08825 [Acidobacteria bacterium]|nr:hypothetical protein [Acidobacteriota bacterium]
MLEFKERSLSITHAAAIIVPRKKHQFIGDSYHFHTSNDPRLPQWAIIAPNTPVSNLNPMSLRLTQNTRSLEKLVAEGVSAP